MAPGSFLVGHIANFGILFLAVLTFWPVMCRLAAGFGLGAWLFMALSLAFSVNAESRHSTAFWPMAVTLVCLALDRYHWRASLVAVFCGLSFLNSRAWVMLNADFPELYFANFSLAMGTFWYVVQAAAFTAVAGYLHLAWGLGSRPVDDGAAGGTT